MNRFATQIQEETLLLEEELQNEQFELVVYNDDVNTFDHVIDCLIKICKHTKEQAEQCTLIIHYKGKCSVKLGTYEKLLPMRQAICDRGISAEIL
ncbi:MAG: ATP-dependent Clp protease adaptor ClpS [Cytophagales bacterium]|nr:MAG: ATP-dependent Clp protease adaptor ClpS [Cytophagales bacterium]